jgi:hypothetical protein
MKVAAHIAFFYIESRIDYLKQVIHGLQNIGYPVQIFIYTNQEIKHIFPEKNIIQKLYSYKKKGTLNPLGYNNGLWKKIGLARFVHPYFLTWENRSVMQEIAEEYDAQLYIEDDVLFTIDNFYYWEKHSSTCLKHGYQLGFCRIEYDRFGQPYLCDILEMPKKIIQIEGNPYLLNDIESYAAFWIADRTELKKFIQSKEWRFDFKGYGIREKSAIGWHGHYKGTLVPLTKDPSGAYLLPKSCTVHHLPNKAVNDPSLTRIALTIANESYFKI